MINSVGITGILLYSLTYFGGGIHLYSGKYILLAISYTTSFIYLAVSLWSLVKEGSKTTIENTYLTIVNTLVVLGVTTQIVPTIYQSLTIACWMLVYIVSGFLVFAKTKNEKLFYIHSLVAVLLLGIATSIELKGPTLVIAFAIEAAIISLVTYIVTESSKTSQNMFYLMLLPGILSLRSLDSYKWVSGVFHSDFAVLFVVGLVFAILGLFYKKIHKSSSNEQGLSGVSFILSTFYLYALIWLSTHSVLYSKDTAVFLSLFVYTVVGLVTHFRGIFSQNSLLKNYGTVLLVCVVLRLLFVDIWNMALPLRVVTFIVLGVLFMSTAFISKKQKSVEQN